MDILVDVICVNQSYSSEYLHYVGEIQESKSSQLSFQLPGGISKINIKENQYVEQGEELILIDDAIYENNYLAASANYQQALDAYSRINVLYENKSIPEIKWIEAKTSLLQAESIKNTAAKNLENCRLIAPFSGIVNDLNAEIGMNVMPSVPILKLIATDDVKIKISVPEHEINRIQRGFPALIEVPALGENGSLSGEVSEVGFVANKLSHSYDVKLQLDYGDSAIKPGMICNTKIYLKGDSLKKIIIPSYSIYKDSNGNKYVWIIKKHIVYKKIIQVGSFYQNGIIVNGGLFEGDSIVTNGGHKISEGLKIRIR
jgi:RND family efflux transporter MFP subunit